MASRALVLALVLAALAVTGLVAQDGAATAEMPSLVRLPAAAGAEAPPAQEARVLTLDEALRLARLNNPGFLSQQNDQAVADWQVREAYGGLLPSVNATGGMSYTEPGVQRVGTLDFGAQSTDWFQSRYFVGLNWNLSGNTLFGIANARAGMAATAAGIAAAEFALESAVTLQYMTALRARDQVEVARRQLEREEQNRAIVGTRVAAGAAAGTEGKQAEVQRGRAEAQLIQAERALRAETLRLMEQMGVAVEGEVVLGSEFQVFEPRWTLEELLASALEAHPQLRAFEAQERANRAAARQARSQYFPSLNINTGLGGNTLQALNESFLVDQAQSSRQSSYSNCMEKNAISAGLSQPLAGYPRDCGAPSLSQEQLAAVVRGNEVFPFDFTKVPLSLNMTVSIPVFTGFTRERQVEQAQSLALDAEHTRRAEELRLRTAVTQAYDNMVSAQQLVQIEARNREVTQEQLDLARQRYALGAAQYLELLDAQNSVTTAERDYLNAVYDFHLALAQLEAATGRTLRETGGDEDGNGEPDPDA